MFAKMNRKRLAAWAALALAVPVSAHVVTAAFAPSCATQPRASWLSAYELGLRLKERGYEMVRLRMGEDRCVEVVAKDHSGQFIDLQVNPFNAQIVKVGGR